MSRYQNEINKQITTRRGCEMRRRRLPLHLLFHVYLWDLAGTPSGAARQLPQRGSLLAAKQCFASLPEGGGNPARRADGGSHNSTVSVKAQKEQWRPGRPPLHGGDSLTAIRSKGRFIPPTFQTNRANRRTPPDARRGSGSRGAYWDTSSK